MASPPPYSVFIQKIPFASFLCIRTREKKNISCGSEESIALGPDWTLLLPDAALSEIFLNFAYTSIHPLTAPCIEAHPHRGPLLLAQISSQWRRVALATPVLWTSIYVGVRMHSQLLKLWLERSKEHPISVRINAVSLEKELQDSPGSANAQPLISEEENQYSWREGDNSMRPSYDRKRNDTDIWENRKSSERNAELNTNTISTCLLLLSYEIYRWRRFDIALDAQSGYAFLNIPISNSLLLEELAIQVVLREGDCMPSRILRFLDSSTLPKTFERLTWESVMNKNPSSLLHNALWSRLSCICLKTGLTMDESVEFLRQCRSAIEVSLECINDDSMDNPRSTERTVLPSLRVLSLGLGGSACDCTLILDRFTFPSLSCLRFQNFRTEHASCVILHEFLQRCRNSYPSPGSSALQHLSINDHYMSREITLKLIREPLIPQTASLSLYTRELFSCEELLGLVDIKDPEIVHKLEYSEDAFRGKWIGWGGLPDSYLV